MALVDLCEALGIDKLAQMRVTVALKKVPGYTNAGMLMLYVCRPLSLTPRQHSQRRHCRNSQ